MILEMHRLVDEVLKINFEKVCLRQLFGFSKEDVLRIFVGHGIIKNTMQCSKCAGRMRVTVRNKLEDGIWVFL